MIKMTGLAVTALIAIGLAIGGNAAIGFRGPAAQNASADCTTFQSPGRLSAGTPFSVALFLGLEFRLSPSWGISVGPVDEPTMDYLWLVSPPLQTAPHMQIGPGYGLTARESARLERPLRFVVTRTDYDAARTAIERESAAETLRRLDQLGRGRLSLTITDYQIRDVQLPDGRQRDAFDWITFKGEACVPRPKLADIQTEPTRAGSLTRAAHLAR